MANKYWIGGTGSWSQTAHWSLSSGGTGGAALPSGDDIATFDSASGSGTCTLDMDVTLSGQGNITINAANMIIEQGAYNISTGTYGSNAFLMQAGTFNGGSGSITVPMLGVFISGGAFRATSGVMSIYTIQITGGTFDHNYGTLSISGITLTVITNNNIFNHVNFTYNSNNVTTITGIMYVIGNLFSNHNTGAPYVVGDIRLVGTGDQNVSGNGGLASGMVQLMIAKPSGTAIMINNLFVQSLTINSGSVLDLNVVGNYTLSVGNMIDNGTILPREGTLRFATATVSKVNNEIFHHVIFSYASNSNEIINGNLYIKGNLTSMHPAGRYVLVNIILVGNGAQVLTGDGVNNDSGVANLSIQKSGGSVTFATAFMVYMRFDIAGAQALVFTATKVYQLARMNIQSVAGSNITFRSSAFGTPYILSLPNEMNVNFLDVQDADATGSTLPLTLGMGCVNSGNNTNFRYRWNVRTVRVRAKATRALASRAVVAYR